MKKNEYKNFERTMQQIMKVPHAVIKAKLEEEKQAKERKKSKKSSAFREADGPV
jgi:hypothetical protein